MAIDFSNTEFDPEALDEPLVTTSLTRRDENEGSLRPQTLREYIGQEKAKGNLEVYIQAAKMRREPLDHVLLHGPPSKKIQKRRRKRFVRHKHSVKNIGFEEIL